MCIGADRSGYNGGWKEGMQHGTGMKKWADGSKYDGKWEKGMQHGQGKYYWENGTRYFGEFSNNRRIKIETHTKSINTLSKKDVIIFRDSTTASNIKKNIDPSTKKCIINEKSTATKEEIDKVLEKHCKKHNHITFKLEMHGTGPENWNPSHQDTIPTDSIRAMLKMAVEKKYDKVTFSNGACGGALFPVGKSNFFYRDIKVAEHIEKIPNGVFIRKAQDDRNVSTFYKKDSYGLNELRPSYGTIGEDGKVLDRDLFQLQVKKNNNKFAFIKEEKVDKKTKQILAPPPPKKKRILNKQGKKTIIRGPFCLNDFESSTSSRYSLFTFEQVVP